MTESTAALDDLMAALREAHTARPGLRDCNAGLCAHGPDAVHVAQPCAGCGRAVGMDAATRDGAGRWVHLGCAPEAGR